jgi:hypothetical protein
MQTAQNLNLSAANFWEWANARRTLPAVFETIKNYPWPTIPGDADIAQLYINALNTHDPNQVIALYNTTAVHVTAARTQQGVGLIRNWYTAFFNNMLPEGKFTLTHFSGTGSSRSLTWTATSKAGAVGDGNDTFGLVNGKISYHFTSFTIA